jgi:hypothetical protein
MWNDVQHADGPGAMFAIVGVGIITLGFVAGAAARFLLLVMPPWRQNLRANIVVGVVSLIGFPAAHYGWQQHQDAAAEKRREPASLACRSTMFDATMGGAKLRIPLVPGISVGTGAEYFPSYPFNIPEYARKFCAIASGQAPVLTNLSMEFDRGVATESSQRQKPICDRARSEAWWPWLCRADRTKRPLIEQLHLFDPERYQAGKMHAFDADRGAYFAKYVPNARWVRDRGFERLDSGSQTDYRADGWPAAASTYYANCSTTSGEEQYCRAGYRLTPSLGIIYAFRSTTESFQEDAIAADRAAQILARSFIVPSAPLSSR